MSLRISTEDTHLLELCAIPPLGPVTCRRLLRAFGSAEEVFQADKADLMGVEGINTVRATAIKTFHKEDANSFRRKVSQLSDKGINIVTYGGEGYPEPLMRLKEDAPIVLYIKGSWMDSDANAVAMVGSRKATQYGLRMTERIASDLTNGGVTVTSGMALGIDTEAHRSAMQAGGRTLAVLGTGIDVIFPAGNRALYHRIADSGAVISQFAPGTPGHRMNFPLRNRLISGLSLGVVVVEAAAKSGSLITAGHALDQGKAVFAIPGNVDSEYSEGTNELIRRGARVITDAKHILDELAPMIKGAKEQTGRGAKTDRPARTLSEEEKTLCSHMSRAPMHIDEIVRASGLTVQQALTLLLTLEIKGTVKQEEGKRFYIR